MLLISFLASLLTYFQPPVTATALPQSSVNASLEAVQPGAASFSSATQLATSGSQSISGTVSDSSGTGIMGISVSLYPTNEASQSWSEPNSSRYFASTDVLGNYSIYGVPPGDYVIRYSSNSFPRVFVTEWWNDKTSFAESEVITITSNSSWENVDVQLEYASSGTGTLTGEVTDEQGNPIEGVNVYPNSPSNFGPPLMQSTDSSGRYSIDIPTGDYIVAFSPEGLNFLSEYYNDQQSYSSATRVTVSAGQTTTLARTMLTAGASVSGRLVNGSGSPLVGVEVGLVEPATGNSWPVGRTNANGEYSGSGFAPGTYTLKFTNCGIWASFTAEGGGAGGGGDCSGSPVITQWWDGKSSEQASTRFTLTAGQVKSGMNAVLEAGSTISGTVRNGSNQTLADISVAAYPVNADGSVGTYSGYSVTTNSSGVYALNGLPAGSYRLEFSDWSNRVYGTTWLDSLSAASSRTVTISASQALGNVNVVMPSTFTLSGKVTNSSGQPVQNVNVVAVDRNGQIVSSFHGSFTDADGNFSVSSVPSGEFTLKAVQNWYSSGAEIFGPTWLGNTGVFGDAQFVRVGASTTNTGKNIQMVSGATLSGTTRVDSGSGAVAAPNTRVDLVTLDRTSTQSVYSSRTGQYSFKGIAPGQYKIEFGNGSQMSTWWGGSFEETATVVTVTAGGSVTGIDGTLTPKLGSVTTSTAPTITGDLTVGSTLTVNSSGWAPSDVTLLYDWQNSGVKTTSNTYVVSAKDAGQRVLVTVYARKAGFEEGVKVALTAGTIAAATNTAFTATTIPTISGTAQVGQTLSASSGAWTPAATLTTYQWLRDGTPISGATSSTYQLVPADIGAIIRVAVTGVREGYWSETTVSSLALEAGQGTITPNSTPTVSGSRKVAEQLTVDTGAWAADTTFTYQWRRDGVDIAGATSSSYTPTVSDFGRSITVKVVGSKTGYTNVERTSTAVAIIAGTQTRQPTPTVSGSYVVGQVLTATPGTWDSGVTFSYRWHRDGVAISGASLSQYTVVADDLGKNLTVTVTGIKTGYTSVSSSSEGQVVQAGTLTLTPIPTYSGSAVVGNTLSVVPGTWDAGVTRNFQWIRNGVAIPGETGSTYKVSSSDVGTVITVRVRGIKAGFTTVNRTSTNTNTVVLPGTSTDTSSSSISGVVTNASGTKLLNAQVSLYLVTDSSQSWEYAGIARYSAWTDFQGRYTINNVEPGEYVIRFNEGNYPGTLSPQWWAGTSKFVESNILTVTSGKSWTDINAVLPAAQTVTGSGILKGDVTRTNNLAIAGVNVCAYRVDGSPFSNSYCMDTDSSGRYSFSAVVPGEYVVSFWPDGLNFLSEYYNDQQSYSSATRVTVSAGQTTTLARTMLTAGASVSGRLVNGSGSPLVGVEVGLVEPATGNSWPVGRTNANGEYSGSGFAPGTYTLKFTNCGMWASFTAEGGGAGGGGDCSGSPVITQWWDGKSSEQASTRFTLTAGQVKSGMNAVLEAGSTISGTVRNGSNQTLADISVAAYPVNADGSVGTYSGYSVTTNSSGGYALNGLPAGSYRLEFSDWSNRVYGTTWLDSLSAASSRTVTITASQALGNVNVVMPSTFTLSGKVTNSSGQPVQGVNVVAVDRNGQIVSSFHGSFTDADGNFSVSSVPSGEFTLKAVQNWYSSGAEIFGPTWLGNTAVFGDAQFVRVGASTTNTGKNIQMVSGATLSGTTRVDSGSGAVAAPNTQVSLVKVGNSSTQWLSPQSVYSSRTGQYSFKGVEPGQYKIRFGGAPNTETWWGGSFEETATIVTVTAGGSVTDIDGTLTPKLGSVTTSTAPTITGDLTVGSTLTVNSSGWAPSDVTLLYEWQYSGVKTTSNTYVVAAKDAGQRVLVTVYARKAGFEEGVKVALTAGTIAAATNTAFTATTIPTISGTAQVGQTLSASSGAWTPAATLTTYQWLRDGAPISGATSSTYQLVPADIGAIIRVAVTGVREGYWSETKLSSGASQVLSEVFIKSPASSITGNAEVGQTLTASNGTWDNDVAVSYRWLRSGQPISGATSSTYEVVNADAGKMIALEIIGTKPFGSQQIKRSPETSLVTGGTLSVSALPSVSGTRWVGNTLQVDPGTWESGTTLTYQWKLNGIALPGETNTWYFTQNRDAAGQISVDVTGTKEGFNNRTVSASLSGNILGGRFEQQPQPEIIAVNTLGQPLYTVGQTVTVSATGWPTGTNFTYQWVRNGNDIPGATDQTYVLQNADAGQNISLKMTAEKYAFYAVTVQSWNQLFITGGTMTNTNPIPSITGERTVGKALTAVQGTWDSGVSFSYQWLRDSAPISGATGQNYTLTSTDAGKQISVRITGSKNGFASIAITSQGSGTIGLALINTPTPTLPSLVYRVGGTVNATLGTWDSGVTRTVQWFRDGVAIQGATSSSYVITPEDHSKRLTVSVTGTKPSYTTVTKTSLASSVVTDGILNTTPTPTIAGQVSVGNTLTAQPGTWNTGVQLSYQWIRGATPISGATSATYQVTQNDLGSTLSVNVTGQLSGYSSKIVGSLPTAAVTLPLTLTPTPTISGSGLIRSQLQIIPGTWDANVSLTYRWESWDNSIVGTSSTYTPPDSMRGYWVKGCVTGTKAGFTPTSVCSNIKFITGFDLTPVPSVRVSGFTWYPVVGQTLNVSMGTWPSGAILYFQWLRDGVAIHEERRTSSYTVTQADAGKELSVRVRAFNLGIYNNVDVTSDPTLMVGGGSFMTSSRPTITGITKVGETLTANPGNWDSGTLFSYRWLRNGLLVATSQSYVLRPEDAGTTISVKLTGTKDGNTPLEITSLSTSFITPADQIISPDARVTGELKVGSTLSAETGSWDSGVVLYYQWYRNGYEVVGATQATYTLTNPDNGQSISVRVTGKKLGFVDKSITSVGSSQVTALTLILKPTPTISGALTVGSTLSANTGTWDAGTTLSYQWQRNGSTIPGATSETYQLQNADAGQRITLQVTGSKYGYLSVTNASSQTSIVTGGTLSGSTPTITGTARVNQVLTASSGTWDSGTTLSYQWLRNGSPISDATQTTYQLREEDSGTQISIKITGTKTGFNSLERVSTSSSTITLNSMTNIPTPTITSTVRVGTTISVNTGTWDSGVTLTYQWMRGVEPIAGQTASTYRPTNDDAGSRLSVRVTASKYGFTSVTRETTQSSTVTNGTLPTATISISGETSVSRVLTSQIQNWDQSIAVQYQWRRNNINISGATSAAYTLSQADAGTKISLQITGTKSGFNSSSAFSTETSIITGGQIGLAANPVISGNTLVGETLQADPGLWDSGTVIAYQWRRDGTDIPGATTRTYLLTTEDIGTSITVVATGNKQGFNPLARVSNPTALVDYSGTSVTRSQQALLWVSTVSDSGQVGVGVPLTSSGGSGTGAVSYFVSSGREICSIVGNTLTASAPGTCGVIARKLSDSSFFEKVSSERIFTFLKEQAPLVIRANSTSALVGADVPITFVGGSGSGQVTYSLVSSPNSCALNGNVLTATAPGTCSVSVTKAADGIFASKTANTVPFTFISSGVRGQITLSGTVTANGEPVTSGQVKVTNCTVGRTSISATADLSESSTGRYSIQLLPGCAGKISFQATEANAANVQFGFYALDNAFVAPLLDVTMDYELPTLVPVTVSVVDSAGRALSDVYVAPDREGSTWPTSFTQASDGTSITGSYSLAQAKGCTTNVSGACTVYVPENSTTTFKSWRTISGNSVAAVGPRVVVVTSSVPVAITFPDVGQNVTISGTLTYQGVPVTSGQVKLENCVVSGLAPVSKTVTISRSSNGRYSFDVPAGCVGQLSYYSSWVSSANLQFGFYALDNAFVAPLVDVTMDYELPTLVPVTVSVVDSAGRALSDVYVAPDREGSTWPTSFTQASDGTSIAGSYSLAQAKGCTTNVSGACTAYVPENSTTTFKSWRTISGNSVAAVGPRVLVATSTVPVAITFPDVGQNVTISGTLTYQGVPVTSGQVKLENCVVSGLAPVSKTVTISRSSNGRYSFDVPAGCVGQLSYFANSVEPLGLNFIYNSVPQPFVAPASPTTLSHELPELIPLTLSVKDAIGTPLSGLTLSPQVSGSTWPTQASELSDGSPVSGTYTVVPSAGCNVTSNGACVMFVPQHSTTTVKSWAKVRGVSSNVETSTFVVGDEASSGVITVAAMSTVQGTGLTPKQIVLNSSDGFVLSDIRTEPVSEEVLPADSKDLTGAISYTVTGMDVGESADITIALPEGTRPNLVYKQINGVFIDVTSIATFEANSVTIRVVDGGLGDEDGVANGQIVDPIVIAQVPVAQSTLTVAPSAFSAYLGTSVSLSTSGGNGTGAVSYQVSGNGCSLNQNLLTISAAGSCSVTATKAGDSDYLDATSAPVSVSFVAVPVAPAPPSASPVENLNTSSGLNRNFVRNLYRDFFNRNATEDEVNYWGNELTAGRVSQASLTTTLSRSDAWIQAVIRGFYVDTLGREPDAAGYAYWIGEARRGKPIADIGSFFYGSDEYFQTTGQGNYTVWINDLYQKLMLRPGDAGGVNYWVSQLNSGMSRPAVSHWFYQSPEKLGLRVDYLYSKLLNRGSDPGGRAYWAGRLYGEGDLSLASMLASSPEYFGRQFLR